MPSARSRLARLLLAMLAASSRGRHGWSCSRKAASASRRLRASKWQRSPRKSRKPELEVEHACENGAEGAGDDGATDAGMRSTRRRSAGDGDAAAARCKQDCRTRNVSSFTTRRCDEVLAAISRKFGYAQAPMLMQAQSRAAPAPVQVRCERRQRSASHAGVAGTQAATRSLLRDRARCRSLSRARYVPAQPISRRAPRAAPGRRSRRLDDRRRRQRAAAAPLGDPGVPIPDSSLRIGKAEPEYFIVWSGRTSAVGRGSRCCACSAAFGALWLRQVGLQRAMAPCAHVETDGSRS